MDIPQDAGTTTTAPPPAAVAAPASADWSQAAQGAAATTPQPDAAQVASGGQPATKTQSQPATQPAAQTDAPAQPGQPPAQAPEPVVVTPQKRGGILGVVDSLADALAGKTRPEIGVDQQGNKYVKEHTLSRGEQWARIGLEAFKGAAEGMAAGRGRGNMGKAAAAGFESGKEDEQKRKDSAKDMDAQVRQQQLDKANNQMFQMQMAEHTWNATRLQIKASQEDEDWADKKDAELEGANATLLGTTAHAGDISHLVEAHPDLMKSLVGYKGAEQDLKFVPNYENGVAAGFKVYKTQPGYNQTVIPDGATFHTFDPATGKTEEHHVSGPAAHGQIDQYEMAYYNKKKAWENDQAELALKKSQAANQESERNAREKELPSKIAQSRAAAAKDWADAHKAQAEADDKAAGDQQARGPLVDEIGQGKMVPGRLSYLLARNPGLMEAVAAKYPGFDSGKIDSYASTYKDFTSGPVSTQLNSGATVLGHLNELRKLNTPLSHLPGTPAYTAYKNKVDTVAPELAKFYGDTTIPAIDSIKSTLGATLPGNRDAAIRTQVQSMADKFASFRQQWNNAAPSAAYEAQMPRMSAEAEQALSDLNDAYNPAQKQQPGAQGGAGLAGPVQPGEHVTSGPAGTIVYRGGKWVNPQTGAEVK